MQEAAAKERLAYEKHEKDLLMQDKECMYDNQMFDNVFFSQKTIVEN